MTNTESAGCQGRCTSRNRVDADASLAPHPIRSGPSHPIGSGCSVARGFQGPMPGHAPSSASLRVRERAALFLAVATGLLTLAAEPRALAATPIPNDPP